MGSMYLFFTAPLVIATTTCDSKGRPLLRLTNTTGVIQTYDGVFYRHNIACQWNLSSDTMLQLQFATLSTHSSADFVTVYDGNSSSASLTGRYNGSSVPEPITSSTNNLYVQFTSDGAGNLPGFKARYRGIAISIKKV